MKLIRNISLLALWAVALSSCESYTKTEIEPHAIKPAIFSSYPTAKITLDKNQSDLSQVTFAWSAANYGYSAAVKYTLKAVAPGKEPVELAQTNLTSVALQNKVLCAALVNGLGAVPTTDFEFNVLLLSSVGPAAYDTISLPVVLTVVPYSLEPTPLWVMGGYCGWNFDNALKIYSENSNGLYKGWVYMNETGVAQDAMTEFKFTSQGDWNGKNYGDTLDPLSADPGAGNIKIANGYCYLFAVDIPNLVAKVDHKFTRLGLIGSATPTEWNTPDTELKWDPVARVFKATGVAMKAGAFKFRADNDWAYNWGAGPADGQLNIAGGGGDITFSKADGIYTVEVDLCRLVPTYKFTAQ